MRVFGSFEGRGFYFFYKRYGLIFLGIGDFEIDMELGVDEGRRTVI